MPAETAQYFDEKAFSTLLNSDDTSLLYPLLNARLTLSHALLKSQLKITRYSNLRHTLKTTCRQLGAKRLANVLSALEKAAAQDDAARCDTLKRLASSEFAQVEGELKSHAEKLKQQA